MLTYIVLSVALGTMLVSVLVMGKLGRVEYKIRYLEDRVNFLELETDMCRQRALVEADLWNSKISDKE